MSVATANDDQPAAGSMIKSELVQRIAGQNPHLYQRDIENIVNAVLGEITAALARGDRVELRGFGAFSVKHRPARTGRNPRTGAHVSVDQKSVPFFKTGKEMRERLNKWREASSRGMHDVREPGAITTTFSDLSRVVVTIARLMVMDSGPSRYSVPE